ncbi:MAG: DNA internalization-related competence protein ComEC/Rec2 [Melioribacteraceae bacterium]|nr:DNA internalization-related competence protein ComEC/Rec2 [Melioribacteraceae bacterium]
MKNYPLIKFVILLFPGIILAESLTESDFVKYFQANALVIIPVVVIFMVLLYELSRKNFITGNLLIMVIVPFTAFLYTSLRTDSVAYYPFETSRIRDSETFGVIESMELPGENRWDMIIRVDSVKFNDNIYRNKIDLLLKINTGNTDINSPIPLYDSFSIGDRIKAIGMIQKARERRNPFEYDFNKYINSKGISALLYVKSFENIYIIENTGLNYSKVQYRLRSSVARLIESLFNRETQALVKGLLLADRKGIDYDTRESFVNAGVIHVLAVSGLHVGFITLIFLFLFSRLNIRVRIMLTILGLWFFVFLTGSPTSVVRASLMASMLLLGYLSIRKYNALNAVSLSALIILIWDPHQLFDPGFQLSFSAVISILILYPLIKKAIDNTRIDSKLFRSAAVFFAVSFSAQLGTLPFTLTYFHKLSIIAILANLVVIPLIGIIVPLAITSIFFASTLGFPAQYYAAVTDFCSGILFEIVDAAGSWDYSFILIPQFSMVDGAIYFTALFFILLLKKLMVNKLAILSASLLIAINAFIWMEIDNKDLLPDNLLSVVMIDIGQGDSFLIKFPDGSVALIDAGEATKKFDNGERVIEPLLNNLDIKKIDMGFVSHVDGDHYGGYIYLLEENHVRKIFKPELDNARKNDVEFEDVIKRNGVPIEYYHKDIMEIGNSRIYVLNNSDNYYSDSNDKSGILKIYYGDYSFLFMGDAGTKVENDLCDIYDEFLKSNILKVGHHGSNTSSSMSFLNKVKPEIALISAGQFNKFGHPSERVMQRLRKINTSICRTDLDKAVILQTDGEELWYREWK